MFRRSCFGQGIGLLLSSFCGGGAGLEAEAVVSGFQDVAVMGQAIEQGRRHLGVAKNPGPFAEAEVGGDDDAGALVKLAEQMEEQGAAGRAERQISEFVEYHEV